MRMAVTTVKSLPLLGCDQSWFVKVTTQIKGIYCNTIDMQENLSNNLEKSYNLIRHLK